MEHDGTKPNKSPQDKKAMSYAHDRRSTYGENDKAYRKTIPARKAEESRNSRRKASQDLKTSARLDEKGVDLLESSLRHDIERVGGWRKKPDVSLGEFRQLQIQRRDQLETKKVGSDD